MSHHESEPSILAEFGLVLAMPFVWAGIYGAAWLWLMVSNPIARCLIVLRQILL